MPDPTSFETLFDPDNLQVDLNSMLQELVNYLDACEPYVFWRFKLFLTQSVPAREAQKRAGQIIPHSLLSGDGGLDAAYERMASTVREDKANRPGARQITVARDDLHQVLGQFAILVQSVLRHIRAGLEAPARPAGALLICHGPTGTPASPEPQGGPVNAPETLRHTKPPTSPTIQRYLARIEEMRDAIKDRKEPMTMMILEVMEGTVKLLDRQGKDFAREVTNQAGRLDNLADRVANLDAKQEES